MLLSLATFCFVVKLLTTKGYDLLEDKYQTVVLDGNYSTNITVTVDANKEFIIHFQESISHFPYTVYASSSQSDVDFPVFIMVRQQKEATSWEIPLLVNSRDGMLSFRKTSRTLCHNNIDLIAQIPRNSLHSGYQGVQKYGLHKRLTMSISTASEVSTNVTVLVEEQDGFYLKEHRNYSVTISPSEPRFFYYKYADEDDTNPASTVILEVDSVDKTCFTVSIQNASCPVFDLNQDISYQGEYETVNTKGGIIIREKVYPNGFFVVFVAKGDNFDCDQKDTVIPMQKFRKIKPSNHSSTVTFKIKPNISKDEYLVASLSTLSVLLLFYVVFGVISCEFCFLEKRQETTRHNSYQPLRNEEKKDSEPSRSNKAEETLKPLEGPSRKEPATYSESTEAMIHETPTFSGTMQTQSSTKTTSINDFSDFLENTVYVSTEEQTNREEATIGLLPRADRENLDQCSEQSSINFVGAPERDTENNQFENVDKKLKSPKLFLSDLATREPKHIHRESLNYFLTVIIIGIFYGIPVVQLVITHQRMVIVTGNLDICYYNFLCAHPYIGLSDYNHVLSNLGYLLLGVLFIIITRRHRKMRHDDNRGIPKHYGLFYAMGTALTMEGILSGCYHVCPNQSNFQFDTSFMYVMAVLCLIKLYQNRHPDVNATAYVTFLIIAVAVLIAMVGILNGHILIWTLFIISYSALCLYVAIKIYFVNKAKRGLTLFLETKRSAGIIEAIKPIKKDRCIAVITVTVLNIIMVHMGYLCHASNVDFGTFLLALLMGNTIIYTFLYVVMKLKNKEKFSIPTIVYLILAAILWGCATYFFVYNSTEWMVTPAESRQWNTQCVLMNFYDYHDIWHLLSAPALFFSFMLLLTLDDELTDTSREEIVVF